MEQLRKNMYMYQFVLFVVFNVVKIVLINFDLSNRKLIKKIKFNNINIIQFICIQYLNKYNKKIKDFF